MPSEFINIALPLVAATVAGVFSYIAGRSMKTHEWKLALTKEKIATRQRLYAEFLGESDRLILQSVEAKINKVSELGVLTRIFGEISLVATDPVVEAAKKICDHVISAHGRENQSDDELAFHKLKQVLITEARKEIAFFERG